MKNELIMIERELLANTYGGDYASTWWKQVKQDYKDGRDRGNAATHALLKGDVGSAAKNMIAAQLDTVALAGDAASPGTTLLALRP